MEGRILNGLDLSTVLAAQASGGTGAAGPLLILIVGIAIVIGMIVALRVNAFLALITAATVVSLLAPGPFANRIGRVAEAFGTTAGKIGVVIALAAIIGDCLIASGAADRVVRVFVRLFGQKRCEVSLMASGFVPSIRSFDTVFYLPLPLALMHRQTRKSYLLLILAMGRASITPWSSDARPADHRRDTGTAGTMIGIGLLCSVPTAVWSVARRFLAKRMEIPCKFSTSRTELIHCRTTSCPACSCPYCPSFCGPLITMHTVVSSLAKKAVPESVLKQLEGYTAVLGNPKLAMMLSAAVALYVLWRQRKPGREGLARMIETSLMSAGVIILITSAGGAFGAMLKEAQIGPAIQNLSIGGDTQLGGLKLLFMGFFVAFLIKFAQGSSTVSMMTTSAMMAALIPSTDVLGYHPVYLAAAIGFGAQCGNWMNDSGFWVFAKMGGLTEVETLKTWTVTVSSTAVIGLFFVTLFAMFLPLT